MAFFKERNKLRTEYSGFQEVIDKIYANRSDMYGIAHAGGSQEPDDIDTLWFLETVMAQMKLIDRRLKQCGKIGHTQD